MEMTSGVDVARVRLVFRGVLRAGGLSLILLAPLVAFPHYRQSIQHYQMWQIGQAMRPDFAMTYATPILLMGLGIWMLVMDRWVMWWIVPALSAGQAVCAGCGYAVDPHVQKRCPECGIALGTAGEKPAEKTVGTAAGANGRTDAS